MNFMHPNLVLDAASWGVEALLTDKGSVRVPSRKLSLRATSELCDVRIGEIVQG
jgi:hypothetical protein